MPRLQERPARGGRRPGLYAYPDVVVACEPLVTTDDHKDTPENLVLITQILSPSTESYDRGEKFLRYQRIPSPRHYMLVAQKSILIDHFARAVQGWALRTYEVPQAIVQPEGLEAALAPETAYANVQVAGG